MGKHMRDKAAITHGVKKIYGIYQNDQLVYVGRTTLRLSQRKANHVQAANRGWASPIWNAIRKHGRDAFTMVLIEAVADGDCVHEREQHYIRTLNPRYNVFDGGSHPHATGYKRASTSAQHRAKLSAAHKGKKHSPETRAKMSATRNGKKHSPETRARMRASQLARWANKKS